ncbi:MAG: lipocalin-like domain-containing protein, partial [Patescibacteria group bacterium]
MKYTPVIFPRDGQGHNNIIEWWYFNGHVHDASGHEYSFMDCLFKANLKKVKIPFLSKLPFHQLSGTPYVYFAHSVVSDIAKQKNYKEIQYVSMSSNDSFS